MIQLYSSQRVREDITEATQEIDAILAFAQGEDRDLTDDEQATVNAKMAEIGEPAEGDKKASGLYAKLADAQRFERHKQRLAASANPQPDPMNGQQPARRVPATPKAHGRLLAFKGEDADGVAFACGQWYLANVRKQESASEWLQNNGGNFGIRAAHTEGTNSAGGFTVPDPLSSTIIDVVERYSVLRPHCRVIPMTSDTLKVPKRSAGLTVDYPGEATGITASDKTWAQVSLAVVKRSILTKVSRELREDTVINVMDDLAMEIGRAFGLQEDNEIINGDGTSTYGSEEGILDQLHANAKNVMGSGDTAFSDAVIADFHATRALLPEKYHPMAMWTMRRDTWHEFVIPLLLAANGASVASYTSGQPAQLFGYPVEFTDYMPASSTSTAMALFGSMRDTVVIGQRSEYTMESSDDFAFDEDVTTLKAGRRYDIKVHSIGTAAADRAMVGLYTAAS